jgi:hypothetical protein
MPLSIISVAPTRAMPVRSIRNQGTLPNARPKYVTEKMATVNQNVMDGFKEIASDSPLKLVQIDDA